MQFGEKLRILRERHHMTQWDLADHMGFDQAHVYRLETGQRKPNVDVILKLSRLFGVSADVLIKEELDLDCPDDDASDV